MFSKTSKPRPQQAPTPIPPLPELTSPQQARKPAAAPGAPRVASMLASDLSFEGNITGAGDLHIDGTVKGDVRVGRLTVGETGNVEGGVVADVVEVRGRIVGAITGKQVKLLGTAYVDGDISHEQLSIDVGAYFQGRCLQTRKGDAPAAAAAQGASPAADSGQLIELKPSPATA